MTMDVVDVGLDVVLAVLYVAVIVFALVVLARMRRGRSIRMFGRAVRRPAVWAAGLICLGVSGLLRAANDHDLPPAGWEGPIRFLDLGLTLAFVVLMVVSVVGPRSPRRREVG
jgi:hypothetical protein